jgi:4,5-dihydroxyphthalate decarboxylase
MAVDRARRRIRSGDSRPRILRSLLDTYGHTRGLKDGTVGSSRVGFEFDEVRPIYDAFSRTVQLLEFDLSELATASYLQAHCYGTDLMLLPVGLLSRFHHGSIVHNVDRGLRTPADLAGRRVGLRSYTQTTAVWARGILMSEYGLDPDQVTWVSFEDGHVPHYTDPPNVVRAEPGQTLDGMLASGQLDAAIVGRLRPGDRQVQNLIPDSRQAELDWFARTGVLPINHMLVVRRQLAQDHPWLVDEVQRLLVACREQYLTELRAGVAEGPDDAFRADLLARGIDPVPLGVEAVRPAVQMMVDFCVAQRLLPDAITVEELFGEHPAALA